ncbi:hypothetical protein [Arcticibacter sp. MXS-1]|uniref:hypothetical protein n=1 Tax=Arcticibacter sp. MXS-1 TaxID=3341726 RepID=UPI0035A90812
MAPFVRLTPLYVKNLYRCLLENGHELELNPGRISILSGRLGGVNILFTEDGSCSVCTEEFQIEVDSISGLSLHLLTRLLLSHNVIRK